MSVLFSQPWDPLGIAKQPAEDGKFLRSVCVNQLMRLLLVIWQTVLNFPDFILCTMAFAFCLFVSIELGSIIPFAVFEASPANGGLLLSYSKEDLGDCVKHLGLSRGQKTSLDSPESGSVLMECWEGCCQALLRLWGQGG